MTQRDSLELSIVGRWAAIHLEGEFDLANANQIPNSARYLVARGVTELGVDLTRTAFLDVTAVNALRSTGEVMAAHGGRLLLLGASGLLVRVLRLTGLDEALAALPRAADPAPAGRRARPRPSGGPCLAADGHPGVSARQVVDASLTAELCRIVRAAVDAVPGCTAASCTVTVRDGQRTVAPSDPVAVACDLAQDAARSGPTWRAARSGTAAWLRAAEGDGGGLARATAVTDACAVPVHLGSAPIGALTCYSAHARGLPAGAEGSARVVAELASSVLTRRLDPAQAGEVDAVAPGAPAPDGAARTTRHLARLLSVREVAPPGDQRRRPCR